jgi:hypothetical protein
VRRTFLNEIGGASREERKVFKPITCDIVSRRLRLVAENGT